LCYFFIEQSIEMKNKALFFWISFLLIAKVAASHDVVVTGAGAKGDSTTMNTAAIQKAIDSCYSTGGGHVIFPKGIYLSGEIHLKSNVVLYLHGSAVLMGSRNLQDYPGKSFIIVRNCENIGLLGPGTINGNGDAYRDVNWQPLPRPQPLILMEHCSFIKLQDVKIINSPSHVFRLLDCREVNVSGIFIHNPERSPNTDGIDIVDSRNVYISNSTIITGDDAICLKSHEAKVENVTVTNCTITSDDGGIKLGTGSKDTIEHCVFSNCVIRHTRFGLALFMQEGGVYRFISFNNISIQNGGRQRNVYPIYVDIDKKTPQGKLGKVEYISFSNLQIETTGNILIAGQPTAPLQNIQLQNIVMRVHNCYDVSSNKKPRGNRKLPVFADMKDLSTQKASLTFGFINGLHMSEVDVKDECTANKRKKIYQVNVIKK
jgi:polygalacturonase